MNSEKVLKKKSTRDYSSGKLKGRHKKQNSLTNSAQMSLPNLIKPQIPLEN